MSVSKSVGRVCMCYVLVVSVCGESMTEWTKGNAHIHLVLAHRRGLNSFLPIPQNTWPHSLIFFVLSAPGHGFVRKMMIMVICVRDERRPMPAVFDSKINAVGRSMAQDNVGNGKRGKGIGGVEGRQRQRYRQRQTQRQRQR